MDITLSSSEASLFQLICHISKLDAYYMEFYGLLKSSSIPYQKNIEIKTVTKL